MSFPLGVTGVNGGGVRRDEHAKEEIVATSWLVVIMLGKPLHVIAGSRPLLDEHEEGDLFNVC